jgi:hypothetical protein
MVQWLPQCSATLWHTSAPPTYTQVLQATSVFPLVIGLFCNTATLTVSVNPVFKANALQVLGLGELPQDKHGALASARRSGGAGSASARSTSSSLGSARRSSGSVNPITGERTSSSTGGTGGGAGAMIADVQAADSVTIPTGRICVGQPRVILLSVASKEGSRLPEGAITVSLAYTSNGEQCTVQAVSAPSAIDPFRAACCWTADAAAVASAAGGSLSVRQKAITDCTARVQALLAAVATAAAPGSGVYVSALDDLLRDLYLGPETSDNDGQIARAVAKQDWYLLVSLVYQLERSCLVLQVRKVGRPLPALCGHRTRVAGN